LAKAKSLQEQIEGLSLWQCEEIALYWLENEQFAPMTAEVIETSLYGWPMGFVYRFTGHWEQGEGRLEWLLE